MKKSKLLGLCLIISTLTLLTARECLAQELVASDLNAINGFELYGSTFRGLYWSAGVGNCANEFLQNVEISWKSYVSAASPINTSATLAVYANCNAAIPNTVRDEGYFYYGDNVTGRLYKKAVNLGPGGAAAEIATGYTPIGSGTTLGALTLWNGVLYWTYYTSSQFLLFSINADGSNPNYIGFGQGSTVTKLMGYQYRSGLSYTNAIFAIAGGNLVRLNLGASGAVSSSVQLATGVTDFAIRDETATFGLNTLHFTMVYATQGFYSPANPPAAPGKLLAINAATGATTTIYDNATSGNNNYQLFSVTVDSKYLFFSEAPVDCGGSPFFSCNLGGYTIRRQLRPNDTKGNGNPFLPIAAPQGPTGGNNLRSDDQWWLYFRQTNHISRLARDTAALAFDMQADQIEVVQTTQNLLNSVKLVTTKPTFVRGYGHVAVNNTLNGTDFPQATLSGFLDGAPLGTISQINNGMIDRTNDLPTLRGNINRSFLFQLPDSWVQNSGNLVVQMTIDPNHLIFETGNLPNTIASPAIPLVNMGTPCLVFTPVSSYSAPTYWPHDNEAGFNSILDRATKLLPVHSFHVDLYNDVITQPVVVFDPWPEIKERSFSFSPCPGNEQQAALNWLSLYNTFQNNPSGCGDTHFVGMLPATEPCFNGVGRNPGSSLLIAMRTAGNYGGAPVYEKPFGGFALAHELGHNYGALHVNNPASCGSSPLGPFANYPYPPCTIDPGPIDLTSPATYYGFDPLTQSVIIPTSSGPGDLMSYVNDTWMADTSIGYFLGAIPGYSFANRPAAGPGPVPPPGPPPPVSLLIHGTLDPVTGLPTLLPFYQLPTSVFDSAKVLASLNAAAQATGSAYRILLLDSTGALLSSTPLLLEETADGDVSQLSFLQFVASDARTRRVQIARTNNMALAERWVSPHMPSLTLNPPVVNAAAQTVDLSWAAADADGDPLLFIVQYSPDGGADWQTRKAAYPNASISLDSRALHGSTNAQLRVIASDGFNSTVATTASFSVAKHAPEMSIGGVSEGQQLLFGGMWALSGMGFDAEDGSLPGAGLTWNLTGPTPRTGTGGFFPLNDLAPGIYSISLNGTDTDGQTGSLSVNFQILPLAVPDQSISPIMDGTCADPAYAGGAFVRFPLVNGQIVPVRLVHCAGNLYVTFSDLPYATNGAPASTVGLQFGPTVGSGYNQNAVGFYVDENGLPFNYRGTLRTHIRTAVSPIAGYAAVISRGAGSWSAELQIPDSLVGGWNHAERVMFAQNGAVWPPSANSSQAQTWPLAYLGTPAPLTPADSQPVANAGPNRTSNLAESQAIFLDGSASFDPNGFALSYAWTQVSGSSVILSNAATVAPSFVGTTNGTTVLGFQLVVSNGSNSSVPAQVQVTLKPAARPTQTVATSSANWSLANGVFQAELTGSGSGGTYWVQASTNLVTWVNFQTNTADFYGRVFFADPQQANYSYRFYRLKSP